MNPESGEVYRESIFIMFKSFSKILFVGGIAMMLAVTSCNKVDVQEVLQDAHFIVNGGSTTMLDRVSFNFVVSPGIRSVLADNNVEITKVEFFFDDELISTSYSEPYKVEGEKSRLSADITHQLYAHIYGRSSADNETFIPLTIKEFIVAGRYDYYLDYNFVGEGDTFTISALLNPDKTDSKVFIKKFSANWGDYSIGTCENDPFSLSHFVVDNAGSDVDVTAKIELSNDVTITAEIPVIIGGDNSTMFRNSIMSASNTFSQSDILRSKAQIFQGKNRKEDIELDIFLDDQKVASTKTFPFIFEKSLQNVSKGTHNLMSEWKRIDANGKGTEIDRVKTKIIVE